MATGVEAAVVRAAAQSLRAVAGRAGKEAKLRQARDAARPLMARETADALLGELTDGEARDLAAYLTSPDFEQVALQVAVARLHERAKEREEVLSAARDQIRHGLRLATAVPDDRRMGITDMIFEALLGAPPSPGGPAEVAAIGHVAAMAARNGQLLGKLTDTAACREAAHRLRAQVATMHAELRMPHTGVSRSVPWDQLYVESMPYDLFGRFTPVRDLAQAGGRLVVLGDPGAGKSTLAAKLAHDLAADPDGTEVPFLVVLRHLSTALQTGERTLAEHLAVVARDPYNVALSTEAIDYLLLNGRAVVILDGLDEMTDVSLRRRVVDLVRGFALLYPMAPIVVTSRRVGYREAALDAVSFPVYELASFTTAQVETYARHWFALDDGTPQVDRHRLAESFLRDSESIEDLRSNPLLLTLLCAMYATDHFIPRLRAQIYERCALMVFERWDIMRGISPPMEFDGRVRGAVQSLAWEMLTGPEAELPEHKVVRLLVAHLMERGFDEDVAQAAAKSFLHYCVGRAWVLAEVGSTELEPVYGFAHRTFMEYFAAEHLVRRQRTPSLVWQVLEPRVTSGQWEAVAQLAVQLLDRNVADGADELLRLALKSLSHAGTPRHQMLDFCVRALGHGSVSPWVAGVITRAAWKSAMSMSEESRFKLFADDRHASALQQADGPLYQLMYHCLSGNLESVRRSLAEEVSARITAGDWLAFLLLDNFDRCYTRDDALRRQSWRDFAREIREADPERYDDWRLARPWALLRNPDHIRSTIDHHGALPLYVSNLVMVGATFPLALDLFRPDSAVTAPDHAHRLRHELMRTPAPWMSLREWRDESAAARVGARPYIFQRLIEMPHPAEGAELASFLVCSLPYLELAREKNRVAVDFANRSTIATMLTGDSHAEAEVDQALTAADLPEYGRDYLMRWRSREFAVLGP